MQATPKSGGEEAVADLEHVGVAAEQRGGDDADGEADEDGGADDVDRALAHELEDDPGDGEAAGDDQGLGVGVHVAADQEVDADRQRRRRRPGWAGARGPRGCRAARPPGPTWPRVGDGLGPGWRPLGAPGSSGSMPKGTAGKSGFGPRSIGAVTFLAHVLEFLVIAGSGRLLGLAAAFLVGPPLRAPALALAPRPRRRPRRPGHPGARSAAGRERYAGRATPEDLSRGAASRVRRRMWVAVEDAEIAVAHAESHDAPVAELPGGVPLAPRRGRRARRAAPPGAPAAPGRRAGPTCAARWPR